MDSIGDLIYVVAIIGYILYSFFNTSKKQKQKRAEEKTTRPDAEPDIKDILEELMGKKRQTQQSASDPVYETRKPTIQPVYESPEEGQSQEGKAMNPVENYEFGKYKTLEEATLEEASSEGVLVDEATVASQYEQFNSANYSEQTAVHSIAEKEGIKEVSHLEEEKETHQRFKDFDIEKAIIYSEILKRPRWV